jgi:uncharacterized membrane protein
MWGVDEIAHFSRAYHISEGHLSEEKLPSGEYGGKLPIPIAETTTATTLDLQNNTPGLMKDVDSRETYANLKAQSLNTGTVDWNFTAAGTYSPLPYLAPATGIFLGRVIHPTVGSVLTGARLATLVVYICLISLALYILRKSHAKWLVFVISLFPMSLFQASIVNVDSLTIGMAMLLFAQIVTLWDRKRPITWKHQLALLATLALLALTKPNYITLAGVLLFLPGRLFKDKLQMWLTKIALPAVAILPALLWTYSIKMITNSTLAPHVANDPTIQFGVAHQIVYITGHPITYTSTLIDNIVGRSWFNQMFSTLGFNFVSLPMIVACFLTVVIVLAVLLNPQGEKQNRSKRPEAGRQSRKWILPTASSVTGLITGLGVITVLYVTYNPVGNKLIEGVQGRYFIPYLPFVVYGLRLLPVRVLMSEKTARILFPSCVVVCLLFATAWYYRLTY